MLFFIWAANPPSTPAFFFSAAFDYAQAAEKKKSSVQVGLRDSVLSESFSSNSNGNIISNS
jgi:hypothetical protein